MKCLSIQIQDFAIPDFDQQDFLNRVRELGRAPEVDAFEEKGKQYLNFNFFTEMPSALLRELQSNIYADKEYGEYIRSISIVACESENSEDDLLLHHFDSTQALDKL